MNKAIGVLALSMIVVGTGFAQQPATDRSAEAWRELANEIRLLRQVMEANAKRQTQFDMSLQRYRLQHELVTNLTNRLEDTRTEIANLQAGGPKIGEQLQTIENQLRQAANPERRTELESALKELQGSQLQEKQRDTELRERETRLVGSLQTEQSRLDGFGQKLENLLLEVERHEK